MPRLRPRQPPLCNENPAYASRLLRHPDASFRHDGKAVLCAAIARIAMSRFRLPHALPLCLAFAAPLGAQVPLQPLRDVQQVAAGGAHTCALTLSGGVKCWGDNGGGQLGDGTTTTRHTPVDVTGLTSGVQAISAGSWHTCALTSGGGVKCWGFNPDGRIGNGQGAFGLKQPTPANVVGLGSGVVAISAGVTHTCALTTGGGVKCWGRNSSGQLGDGSTTQRLAPVNVSGLAGGVTAISAGGGEARGHTCARTATGEARCWGYNQEGQLGDGTLVNRLTPVAVAGLGGSIAAIGVGDYHTCALTAGGGVKCWGNNAWFALGNPDFSADHSIAPINVANLGSGMAAISASSDYGHACALTQALGGRLMCWGELYFQVGGVWPTFTWGPVDQGFSDLAQISAGGSMLSSHVCAVTAEGGVKCRGGNDSGQLGNGQAATYVPTPVDVLVPPPPVVLSISIERLSGAQGDAGTRNYLVGVFNSGRETAQMVQSNLVTAGLVGLSWWCDAPGGSSQTQGTGAVSTSFALGPGAAAWIELQGTLDPAAAFVDISARAATASGGGVIAQRNYSEIANGLGVMKDGFED